VRDVLRATNPPDLHWVKGSHIIVPALYPEKTAYTLQLPDGRVMFVLPYEQDFSLIGTTDISVDTLSNIAASENEINYLIEGVNTYFDKQLTRADVIYHFAGVRGLYGKHHDNASKISRDYKIEVSPQTPPLLSILGGKLTTYRLIAERTVDALRVYFPQLPMCRTATTALPGGDFTGGIDKLIETLQAQYPPLPAQQLARYARAYGSRCHLFLDGVASVSDLGRHFGADLYEKEVRYLVDHEWAQTVEDILWRRSKLELMLTPEEKAALRDYLGG
jgi:glycerol-3-phosphate dehydrogenase